MRHLDLFSGIGGFALAADRVFGNVEHIFCEIDPFCQEVLKKHWPEAKIYGDIRTLTNADFWASRPGNVAESGAEAHKKSRPDDRSIDLLTGGFPCQPFSQAGRRRGTEDDRHLWPEMLRVIQEFHPRWVIGENVGGFVTWNDGMVLEQVHTDLEGEGYEVQAFIIPAVAVQAPHRRDRVWIVATNTTGERRFTGGSDRKGRHVLRNEVGDAEESEPKRNRRERGSSETDSNAKNSIGKRRGGWVEGVRQVLERRESEAQDERPSWKDDWLEVATRLCRVDDGVRTWVDGLGKVRNSRNARLKALGNAIVPAVAEQIMLAIKETCGTMEV